ncbi:hypothetical protein GCK32_017327, partial [Trichostrongylus colubriformis]
MAYVKGPSPHKSNMGLILAGIGALVLVLCITVVIVAVVLQHRRQVKQKKAAKKKKTMVKPPRKMESADIYATKFTHGGALVLDTKMKGPVKHACEGQTENSLQNVEFDPALNEIVDIGTNIDVVT